MTNPLWLSLVCCRECHRSSITSNVCFCLCPFRHLPERAMKRPSPPAIPRQAFKRHRGRSTKSCEPDLPSNKAVPLGTFGTILSEIIGCARTRWMNFQGGPILVVNPHLEISFFSTPPPSWVRFLDKQLPVTPVQLLGKFSTRNLVDDNSNKETVARGKPPHRSPAGGSLAPTRGRPSTPALPQRSRSWPRTAGDLVFFVPR